MENNRIHLMGDYNDRLDEVRSSLYRLLEFEQDDFSETKSLAKREVMYQLNELRIMIDNL